MNPAKLLRDIAGTRIGLRASPIHGVGVFALTDLPAGADDLFAPPAGDWVGVPHSDIEALPPHARTLVDTYCLKDDDKTYLPPHGFRLMDLVLFLNHSDEPNLKQVDAGDSFVTLRDIAAGEELLLDYETLATE